MKHLLICGIGTGMSTSIKTIKELGIYITIITDNSHEYGLEYADKIILAYPRDINIVLNSIKANNIQKVDGVFSLGYENLPVIASICEHFGINGITMEQALNCTLKDRRIEILKRNNVNVPFFKIIKSIEESLSFSKYLKYPVIIKPNDKTSSIGVLKVMNESEFLFALEHSFSLSNYHTVLVEEYLEGTEHTFEGFVVNSEIFYTGISDRNYTQKNLFHPYIFENGDTLPSKLSSLCISKIQDEIKKSISALNINNLTFHCDILLVNNQTPYVLEIVSRISGAKFGTDLVPLSNGINIIKNAIRLSLNLPIEKEDLKAKYCRFVISRYLFPLKSGKVKYIGNINLVKDKFENIYDIIWEKKIEIGDQINNYQSGKDLIASVIVWGSTLQEAENLAEECLKNIPIIIE